MCNLIGHVHLWTLMFDVRHFMIIFVRLCIAGNAGNSSWKKLVWIWREQSWILMNSMISVTWVTRLAVTKHQQLWRDYRSAFLHIHSICSDLYSICIVQYVSWSWEIRLWNVIFITRAFVRELVAISKSLSCTLRHATSVLWKPLILDGSLAALKAFNAMSIRRRLLGQMVGIN